MKTRLRLTLACTEADQTRDLTQGLVEAEGIDLTYIPLPIAEMFHRFLDRREFDVSECSTGRYTALRAKADRTFTAIPVFPSRIFRHSAIFVRRGSPLRRPEELRGKRVGIPEIAQTAVIYIRGVLANEYGVGYDAVDWIVRPVPELDTMLLGGTIDALACADPPGSFERGESVRLITDYRAAEAAYYRKTGVFPIMHLIAMRTEILDAHPWVATSLFKAFTEAKRRSLARFENNSVACYPMPWIPAIADDARAALGDDWWPYGLEPNRRTLETFLRYAHEQGVTDRRVDAAELFPVAT